MTAAELLHQAQAHGITLWAEGTTLRYQGKEDILEALLPEMAARKPELLALLAPANDFPPLAEENPKTPPIGPDKPDETQPSVVRPLTDADLGRLMISTAASHGLHPQDLWRWLSQEDIAALRAGDPDELNALRAFAESRSRTGDHFPGAHDLPFPGEPPPEPAAGAVSLQYDDRRACTDCANLTQTGRCLAAWRGEIVAANRYTPKAELPRRCEGYAPTPSDPDQRLGRERWPGLPNFEDSFKTIEASR